MISPRVSNRTPRSFRNVLRVLFCFLVLLFLPLLLLFLLVFLFVSSSSFTPILVILVKVYFLRVTPPVLSKRHQNSSRSWSNPRRRRRWYLSCPSLTRCCVLVSTRVNVSSIRSCSGLNRYLLASLAFEDAHAETSGRSYLGIFDSR